MGFLHQLHHYATRLIAALLALVVAAMALGVTTAEDPAPVRTAKQHALHAAAEQLRAVGYTDDSAEIRTLSAAWFDEQDKLDVVARVVMGEAADCPAEHQIAVAAVVVNRVNDERFPDTVREVVAQPGQYSKSYLTGFERTTRSCYEAAKIALDGEHDVPPDVVWQAQFRQGREVWWISSVDTGWFASTTYFCR